MILRCYGTIEKDEIIAAEKAQVAAARAATGLSQAPFARLLSVSVRTLQKWEQGRKVPSGAVATLLIVAARHPEVLQERLRNKLRAFGDNVNLRIFAVALAHAHRINAPFGKITGLRAHAHVNRSRAS